MSSATAYVTGTVVTPPTPYEGPAGSSQRVVFSVKVNPSGTDGPAGRPWLLTVRAFGGLAENIGRHVRRGDRVVMDGRLGPNYVGDERTGETALFAAHVALDLRALDERETQHESLRAVPA